MTLNRARLPLDLDAVSSRESSRESYRESRPGLVPSISRRGQPSFASSSPESPHTTTTILSATMGSVSEKSSVLHRSLKEIPLRVERGQGSYLILQDGLRILDACGGAAVTCIGHGDSRVAEAIKEQASKVSFFSSAFYTTDVVEDLCRELVDSTEGHMARAVIYNSGETPISFSHSTRPNRLTNLVFSKN